MLKLKLVLASLTIVLTTTSCGIAQKANVSREREQINKNVNSIKSDCTSQLDDSEFDPLRDKIELNRKTGSVPPFKFTSLTIIPTELDLPAIKKWAVLREICNNKILETVNYKSALNISQKRILEKEKMSMSELSSLTGQLVVALYQRKLNYGEFAQKRYEVESSIMNSLSAFKNNIVAQDMARREAANKELDADIDRFIQNTRAISSRNSAPINCTSFVWGQQITTNCQ